MAITHHAPAIPSPRSQLPLLPGSLLSPRLLGGIICITAAAGSLAAAGLAAATTVLGSNLLRPFRSLRPGVFGGVVFVAAEMAFAAWWWLVLRRRLEAMPEQHAPSLQKPEKDFRCMITMAKMARASHAEHLDAPPAAVFQTGLSSPNSVLVEASPAPKPFPDSPSNAVLLPKDLPVLDMRLFLSEWFLGVDFEHVYQGNLAELLAYGFYYMTIPEMEAAGQGDLPLEMARQLEDATGTRLQPGYNPGLKAMFHLWEPLRCSYMPLTFYMVMELLAVWTRAVMTLVLGFTLLKTIHPRGSSGSPQQVQLSGRSLTRRLLRLGKAAQGVLSRSSSTQRSWGSFSQLPSGCSAGKAEALKQGGSNGAGVTCQVREQSDGSSCSLMGAHCSPYNEAQSAGGAHSPSPALQSTATPSPPPSTPRAPPPSDPCSVSMYIRHGQPTSGQLPDSSTPILFLHGVGVGLLPYLPFVERLTISGRTVICMEARHVSMRLCDHIPRPDQVAEDVVAALDSLGVSKVICVGHSYGTFVASCLAQRHQDRLQALCLIDPVCLGVFLPNLVGSFVYGRSRLSARGNGRFMRSVLRLVASEVHMAATFCRKFYWSDVNLWAEDVPPNTLVVMSGKDELLHVEEMRYILTHHTTAQVLFHEDHEHAGLLVDGQWQNDILTAVLQLAASAERCSQ